LLTIPKEHIVKSVAVVPGIDGRKMSKSYKNTIGIFDEGKMLKKKVMSIQTDSTPLDEPKDPEKCNVFALIKLFADEKKEFKIAERYRAGRYGYGHAKKELLALIEDYFTEARAKRRELETDMDYVRDVLKEGGQAARNRAESVMKPIREATGIIKNHSF
jgi:tryptophanyl-tRNA synthetase